MKWLIVTCDKSKHIVPVQQYLFNKYAPGVDVWYIDVGSKPIEIWGQNVLNRITDVMDQYVVFGLDDYLPTGPFNVELFDEALYITQTAKYERFELGFGAHRKAGMISQELGEMYTFLEYGKETPYSVSCQFSIWKMTALKRELGKCTNPWNFEVTGRAKAACFSHPIMRWIEESALSRKWQGINLSGLDPVVVEELIFKGLIKRNQIRQ